jgi:rubrerythrin
VGLPEDEVVRIAQTSADELISKLARYALTYKEPVSVPEGLRESMGEELTAANWYRRRAQHARAHGDNKTADLYEHIARDEDGHYISLTQRFDQIPRGR